MIQNIVPSSSIEGEQLVEFHPVAPINQPAPIQFDIPATFTHLTDPNFFLKISAKLTKADGTNIAAATRIAPANLTLHSIFKDVIVKANGTILNQATGTYPYKAYFETNFTYSSAAKNGSVGVPQMYYKETVGKFNSTDTANEGFDKRVKKFENGKEVEMGGRIHCNIFLQNQPIIPGVNFSITLIPSSTEFHILSGIAAPAGEKLKITKAVLVLRRIAISNSGILNIERALQRKPITYNIQHAVVRAAHVSTGQTVISNFVINNGQIPRIVIVTFVKSGNFTGGYKTNPFDFSWENCKTAHLSVDGRIVPSLPYKPNESSLEPYLNSLRIANKLYSDSDTGITLDDFSDKGHQILPFDLFPHEAGVPTKTNGVVTFTGHWDTTAFEDNYVMLFYMLFDNTINIDERRNVTLDFVP